jgi:hypothetical protein
VAEERAVAAERRAADAERFVEVAAAEAAQAEQTKVLQSAEAAGEQLREEVKRITADAAMAAELTASRHRTETAESRVGQLEAEAKVRSPWLYVVWRRSLAEGGSAERRV